MIPDKHAILRLPQSASKYGSGIALRSQGTQGPVYGSRIGRVIAELTKRRTVRPIECFSLLGS